MKKISQFDKEFAFLSNFYASPFQDLSGNTWPTVEHAYQAAKTKVPSEQKLIRDAETPGQSKRLGKKITMRDNWEDIKLDVMEALVTFKFQQNPDLAAKLIATGDAELIEGNSWNDTFWGVCKGEGLNHLGLTLMTVRESLKNQKGH